MQKHAHTRTQYLFLIDRWRNTTLHIVPIDIANIPCLRFTIVYFGWHPVRSITRMIHMHDSDLLASNEAGSRTLSQCGRRGVSDHPLSSLENPEGVRIRGHIGVIA